MTSARPQLRIDGRAILREVLAAYRDPFAPILTADRTRALLIRFTAGPEQPDAWAARMRASAISAEQKVRTFTTLGVHVEHVVWPDTVAAATVIDRILAANTDPTVAAIIVQSPPPPRLRDTLDLIAPDKDLDALGVASTQSACATADAIVRITTPFLSAPDHASGSASAAAPTVAVVGARGFVGAGVARLLRAGGHTPVELDVGDDLRELRDADIVLTATGRPGLLTTAHLTDRHRLVVDAGFVPQPTGPPQGDVAPAAAALPAAITPVPGGVGPAEMAVLAERLITARVAPDLAPWRYQPPAPPSTDTSDRAAARTDATPSPAAGQPLPLRPAVDPSALELARAAWRVRRGGGEDPVGEGRPPPTQAPPAQHQGSRHHLR